MKVTVKLDLLGLRPFEVREREMTFELPEGAIFEDLAELIEQRNPGFQRTALGHASECTAEFVVLLNGSNVLYSGGRHASLQDADVIHVIPSVAGG